VAGIDPIDSRKAEKAQRAVEGAITLSFREAAKQFFDMHEKHWRNRKRRGQFLASLESHVFPGRDFAARLGLVPKQMSTGDRTFLAASPARKSLCAHAVHPSRPHHSASSHELGEA